MLDKYSYVTANGYTIVINPAFLSVIDKKSEANLIVEVHKYNYPYRFTVRYARSCSLEFICNEFIPASYLQEVFLESTQQWICAIFEELVLNKGVLAVDKAREYIYPIFLDLLNRDTPRNKMLDREYIKKAILNDNMLKTKLYVKIDDNCSNSYSSIANAVYNENSYNNMDKANMMSFAFVKNALVSKVNLLQQEILKKREENG